MKALKLFFIVLFITNSPRVLAQMNVYVFQATGVFSADKKDLQGDPIWVELPNLKDLIVVWDRDNDKIYIKTPELQTLFIAHKYPEINEKGISLDKLDCIDQSYTKCEVIFATILTSDNKYHEQLSVTYKEALYRYDLIIHTPATTK